MDTVELIELLKLLYGLTDSEDYLHDVFSNHLKGDLSINPIYGDLTMFTKILNDNPACMIIFYVYDNIATEPLRFDDSSRATEARFDPKGRSYEISYSL